MIRFNEPTAFAFCPKCGSDQFLSRNNGRSFLCEQCQFSYYINASAAVACLIFNPEGELLLARRAEEPNKGMLDLPGGFVEPSETLEEAIIREIREELNLKVTNMEYLVSFPNLYPYCNFVVPTIDVAFLCETEQIGQLRVADDVASVEFKHPRLINANDLCSESMRNIIQYYISEFLD